MTARRILVGVCLAGLVGCSSKPPAAWMLYSRANYLYGRMEAKLEESCSPPTAKLKAVCEEGSRDRQEIKMVKPAIEAELSKSSPDWNQIFKYVDLVLGMASKFVAIP